MPPPPSAFYRSPIVLKEVERIVPEPYRTLFLIHAHMPKASREFLATAKIEDVVVNGAEDIRVKGLPIPKRDHALFLSYLRGWLVRQPTPWLFPLPSDGTKHLSIPLAKRYISDIANARDRKPRGAKEASP